MRLRTLLTVLLFLLLPTAILTLLAGQWLRNRELFLTVRIKSSALSAVRAVSDRVAGELDDEVEDLRVFVADHLARAEEGAGLNDAARRFVASRPLVSSVSVFMNPWGFVYKDPAPPARPAPEQPAAAVLPDAEDALPEKLVQELRQQIASATSWDQDIHVTSDNVSYCFRRLSERRALYVGFSIDAAGLSSILRKALHDFSGGGMALYARGPGLDPGIPQASGIPEVTVSDSLGLGGTPTPERDHEAEQLACVRLREPLDHIEICAMVADRAELGRTDRLRLHLHAWGALLIAGTIAIGVLAVLRQTSSELRDARARSDFVIGVSHDLRTPVASMRMLSESILEGRVPDVEKQRQFLELMVRECEKLGQLVERVLFFVRYGQGALAFSPEPVDTGGLVQEVVNRFMARFRMASSAGGAQACDEVRVISNGVLPNLCVDVAAMEQVLLNLLDNAWKYSEKSMSDAAASASDEGVRPRIEVNLGPCRRRVGLRLGQEGVCISVRDWGVGIESRACRKIFRKFYRGPGAVHSNVSGVGLGLAVCHYVVRAHRGRIEVESELGKGSVFTVWLPAASTS